MKNEGAPMTSAPQDGTSVVSVDFMQQMMQVMVTEMGKIMATI